MRPFPFVLSVAALSLMPLHGFAQHLEHSGLRLRMRTTATIPRFLDIRAAQAPSTGAEGGARAFSLSVRANCPWVLWAELEGGVDSRGVLQQVKDGIVATELVAGSPVSLGCQVPHFAGEHLLRFVLLPSLEAGGSLSGPLCLRFWVQSAEGGRSCSSTVTVR